MGSDPSPVVSSGDIWSVSRWAFQNKIDMGILEQASSIVEWRLLRDLAYEEGLREMVLFSLKKRRLRRILSMHINTWWENVKKRDTGSQWYLMKGQEATNTNCLNRKEQEIPLKYRRELFHCLWWNTKTCCSESYHAWRYQKLDWTWSWVAYSNWLCFEQGCWTRWSSEVFSQLSDSVIWRLSK